MKRFGFANALAGLLLCTVEAWCDEPPALPDTPAGGQMKRLLATLESGKRNEILSFIQESCAVSILEAIPLDRHVDILARHAEETGGVVPRQILSASKTNLRLIGEVKKGGGRLQVGVEVEAAQPHKITRLSLRPPETWEQVPVPAVPEGPLSHPEIAAWIEDYMERLNQADAFSGAVLVAHGDEVFFAKACGLASRAWNQPNRLDTKFNLGSMNKMFTSVAIAQLVENGKVTLDDTIGKHLSEYPNRDAARKVTVRHLLTHTSGLADYFNDKFMNASRDRFRAIEDYFPLFADEPLEFEPGTRFRYSNAGFMVLGAIVQQASGIDYFDYVRQQVYKPAGMINTDAYELDTDVPNLAVGYTRDPGGKPGVSWVGPSRGPAVRNNIFMHVIKGGPAGGGYSTVEDLHRFASTLRVGKLIRPETLRQWTTPGDKNPNYAFGFQLYQASGPKIIGHGGGFPGISAALSVDLDNGYTLAALSNMDGGTRPILEQLKPLLARVQK